MINEEYIQELHDKLYKSPTIYEWEFSGFAGRYASLVRGIAVIVISGLIPVSFFIASDVSVPSLGFWFLLALFFLGYFLGRYLLLPDREYCYHLTHRGIHYQEKLAIPNSAYAAVRVFSWVGMAVCIVALVLIGPLAFVGVGGCALLSFGLTNFKPQVEELEVYFSEQVIVFDPIKDTVLDLDTNTYNDPIFSRTIFFNSFEDKNKFISELKNIHNNVEHNRLKRLKDQYNHPIFNQELTDD